MTLVRRIKCWLHDLPKTPRGTSNASATAEEAIERFLKTNARHLLDRRFIATIQAIYEVGGVDGLAAWSYSRVDQGIGSKGEINQLKRMIYAAHNAEKRGAKQHSEWCEKKAAQLDYEHLWSRLLREKALEDRARDRREAEDPREVTKRRIFRHRLEHTVALPAAEPVRERELVGAGAVVSRRALDVPSKPLAAPLMRNEAVVAEVAPAAVQPKGHSHSRQVKGECGQRISDKLDAIIQEIHGPRIEDESEWGDDGEPLGFDALLAQIRHEATCQSSCCATPEPISTVVDPPVEVVVTPGGGDDSKGARSSAAGGSGFPNADQLSGSAWQLVAGTDPDEHGQVESLEHLEHLLKTSPEVAGPMLMGALVRLRAALQLIPRDADPMQEVSIPACDAVLLSRSVLRGLR